HSAVRGVPAAYGEFMRANPPIHGPGTGPARILAGERVVHVADMKDTDLYRSGDANRLAIVDLAGARSIVLIPLLKDETVRGTMLEKATRLCDGIQGVLWTIDGERVKLVADYGITGEFVEVLRVCERPEVGPPPPLLQIMRGERLINVGDLTAHELFRTGHPV